MSCCGTCRGWLPEAPLPEGSRSLPPPERAPAVKLRADLPGLGRVTPASSVRSEEGCVNADAPRRPPGMHDVAALAGVSHQTVSRVLNDHPSVRPETRDKVLAAVARLNYRRNSAARALVTRRTGVVGVVTPATALYGPSSTLLGLEEAARLSGLYVSVATVRNFEAETMKRILEHFFDQGVDGVAVIAPTVEIVDVLAGTRSDVPLVMVS